MKRHQWIGLLGATAMLVGLVNGSALADETVTIGGSRAVLRVCEATRPVSRTGGAAFFTMHRRARTQADAKRAKWTPDQQRTASRCAASGARISHPEARRAYAARGLAVLVADANTPLDGAIQYMAAIKRPVTVIGTSRGTLRAAEGIARGARPDALVLTSGFLSAESGSGQNVMSILGSPSSLPRTLVIHHSQDSCRATLPAGVEPFVKWSAGRARAVWVSGGLNEGDPCEPGAHHGFNGLDGQIVGIAAGFH